MTSSALAAPLGSRPLPVPKPRIESLPDECYLPGAGQEAVDLIDLVGMPLLPWQRSALAQMVTERHPGRWACPQFGLVVPRQNGKSYLLAARIIAGLVLYGERTITMTAHKVETALEVFALVDQWLRACPDTKRLLRQTKTARGQEEVRMLNGNRLRVQARSSSGGRGFSGDLILLDEALELRDLAPMRAMIPTLATAPNAQVIYSSSAGDPGSVVLKDIRDRGIAHARGLGYVEYSAPADTSPDDMDATIAANPAYGHLISDDSIALERAAMDDEGFRTERQGVWATDLSQAVIPVGAWQATARYVDAPAVGARVAFDVAPDRSWATVTAAFEHERKRHLQVSRHMAGDEWLVDELVGLHEAGVPLWADTVGPALDIIERLKVRGVPVSTVNGPQYAAACASLLAGLVSGAVTHQDGDLALDDAARIATARKLGEGWAFARRDASAPITPITSAAVALWGLTHETPLAPRTPFRIY